jgi:hypothetical protein
MGRTAFRRPGRSRIVSANDSSQRGLHLTLPALRLTGMHYRHRPAVAIPLQSDQRGGVCYVVGCLRLQVRQFIDLLTRKQIIRQSLRAEYLNLAAEEAPQLTGLICCDDVVALQDVNSSLFSRYILKDLQETRAVRQLLRLSIKSQPNGLKWCVPVVVCLNEVAAGTAAVIDGTSGEGIDAVSRLRGVTAAAGCG